MTEEFYIREDCRSCGGVRLIKFLEFPRSPLAGGFLRKEDFSSEKLYPLSVVFCDICKQVQSPEVVPANELFRDYRFLASTTRTLSDHFREYAVEMRKILPEKDAFVVEFGCNDGVLLRPFMDLGINAIGVEPAANVAAIAESRGCRVINNFFTPEIARQIAGSYSLADLICANNVFAHMDNILEVLEGVDLLLHPDGVFVFEVHYLLDLVDQFQFDMMYHEHLLHHSLISLSYLLGRVNLEIVDFRRIPIHSGSIRVLCRKKSSLKRKPSPEVSRQLDLERARGLDNVETFLQFGRDAVLKRDKLISLVASLKSAGKKIVGYGASGRSTVHLNFCGFTGDTIEYVADASPERHGRYVPGVRIPIVPDTQFRKDAPDFAILFAYNYLDEISAKECEFIMRGGRFIIPLPEPRILDA